MMEIVFAIAGVVLGALIGLHWMADWNRMHSISYKPGRTPLNNGYHD